MNRKLKLLFVFAAMLMLVCRCQSGIPTLGNTSNSYTLADGSPLACSLYNEWVDINTWTEVYACYYTCPDGKKVEIDYYPKASFPYHSVESLDFQTQINAQYCGVNPPVTRPPISISPLLTGDVTDCNLNSNYINFRLAQSSQDITGKKLGVTMNGNPSSCSINPSNPTILTCDLSAQTLFPITVEVKLDEALVNNFLYDGSDCKGSLSNDNHHQNQDNGGSGPLPPIEPPPPPIEPPPHSP